jgi:hypothetical protein
VASTRAVIARSSEVAVTIPLVLPAMVLSSVTSIVPELILTAIVSNKCHYWRFIDYRIW